MATTADTVVTCDHCGTDVDTADPNTVYPHGDTMHGEPCHTDHARTCSDCSDGDPERD